MNFHAPIKLRHQLSQYSIVALVGLMALAVIVITAHPFRASNGISVSNAITPPGSAVGSQTTSHNESLITVTQSTQSGSSGLGGTTDHHHHHDDGTNSTDES